MGAKLCGLLWLGLATNAYSSCEVVLPDNIQQGSLVKVHASPELTLSYLGRQLARTNEGAAVFGIAYNAPKTMALHAKGPGCNSELRFPVAQRSYRVERVDGVPQNTVTPDPETAKRIAAEGAMITAARAIDSKRLDWRMPMIWPAKGRESGVYGSQRVLNGTPGSPHLGLDMAAPTGTPVLAALPGVVSLAHQGMVMTGKTVLLDHGFGISTIYIHLSAVDVKEGQYVSQGQRLGAIGSTGRSSGPHLHFQVHWYQEKLDPKLVLPAQ